MKLKVNIWIFIIIFLLTILVKKNYNYQIIRFIDLNYKEQNFEKNLVTIKKNLEINTKNYLFLILIKKTHF